MNTVTLAYVDGLGKEDALVGDVVEVKGDDHPVLVVVHCFHAAICEINMVIGLSAYLKHVEIRYLQSPCNQWSSPAQASVFPPP